MMRKRRSGGNTGNPASVGLQNREYIAEFIKPAALTRAFLCHEAAAGDRQKTLLFNGATVLCRSFSTPGR